MSDTLVTLLRLCAWASAISGVIAMFVWWPYAEGQDAQMRRALQRSDCVVEAIRENRSTAPCIAITDAPEQTTVEYAFAISLMISGLVSALLFAAIAAIVDHLAAIRQQLAPVQPPKPSAAKPPPTRFPGQRF